MLQGILILICYGTGLHFYLVNHFIADTLIAPPLYMDGRVRKVPGYLLTRLDIRLTEMTKLSENAHMNLTAMTRWTCIFHDSEGPNRI